MAFRQDQKASRYHLASLGFRPGAFGFPTRGDALSFHFRGRGGALMTFLSSALNFRYSGIAVMLSASLSFSTTITPPPDWLGYSTSAAFQRPIPILYETAQHPSVCARCSGRSVRQGTGTNDRAQH